MKTNNHTQATARPPSITKAMSRIFLTIAISKQLNAVPYLRHKPWQLLWEATVPTVRLAGQTEMEILSIRKEPMLSGFSYSKC